MYGIQKLCCFSVIVSWSCGRNSYILYTVPEDSENFVTNNYGAGRLFSVTKVFVIDSWRPAVIVISHEIYKPFGTVYLGSSRGHKNTK
jgi:hypothetical protein